jgi:hypothetical protein
VTKLQRVFLRIWIAQLVKKCHTFIEHEVLSTCSQEPAIRPYPWYGRFESTLIYILFVRSTLILFCVVRLSPKDADDTLQPWRRRFYVPPKRWYPPTNTQALKPRRPPKTSLPPWEPQISSPHVSRPQFYTDIKKTWLIKTYNIQIFKKSCTFS